MAKELVAMEGEDFEPGVPPFLVCLDHFLIVLRCKSSLAGHIDHHYQLFVAKSVEIEIFAHDVSDLEVKEACPPFASHPLTP